jgi:hypothetical protein
MAPIYCLWVSVFGIMNLFLEETGILFKKRSLTEVYSPPAAAALIAKRMSSGFRL